MKNFPFARLTRTFLCIAAVACAPIVPVPLPPPDPLPGDCDTAAANLAKLGGCGMDMATFAQDCRDASRAEEKLGVRLPTGCLSNSADCPSARACK